MTLSGSNNQSILLRIAPTITQFNAGQIFEDYHQKYLMFRVQRKCRWSAMATYVIMFTSFSTIKSECFSLS